MSTSTVTAAASPSADVADECNFLNDDDSERPLPGEVTLEHVTCPRCGDHGEYIACRTHTVEYLTGDVWCSDCEEETGVRYVMAPWTEAR